MPRRSSLLVVFLIISFLLVSVAYAMGGVPPNTTTTTVVSSATPGSNKYISANIYTDKKIYKIGEPIKIIIRTENTSGNEIKSYYRSSKKSEAVVYDDNNNEIWSSSHGKMALTVIVPFELRADEKIEDEYIWTQQRNDGSEIGPGKYYVQGKINIASPIVTKLRAIQIVN